MLILAATPIGRVADASARLATLLGTADVVAAEDTRRLRRLARDLGVEIGGRVVSYFEGNEQRRTPELMESLLADETVVVVTDAGMPSVSDPGYRLVVAAIEAEVQVTTAPGPSAVLAALAVSGLPTDRFCFEGFLPRKSGERTRRLTGCEAETRTLVFFESPHRTASTLSAMAQVWGRERRAAVCRELTKTHEETRRGTLGELLDWATPHGATPHGADDHRVRGEVTIVVEGTSPAPREYDAGELTHLVDRQEATGMTRKDAIIAVAHQTGVRKREVFDAVHSPQAHS